MQYAAGQLTDAERALRRAIRLDPDFAPAAENLGALLFGHLCKGEPTAAAAPWGLRAHMALEQVEFEYVVSLLRESRVENIPGDLAEFGIFEGRWINFFYEQIEQLGLPRRIYGFNSFRRPLRARPEVRLLVLAKRANTPAASIRPREMFCSIRARGSAWSKVF